MRTFLIFSGCSGFLVFFLLQLSCGVSPCTNGYEQSTISPSGRPCTDDCQCSNQRYEGYCGASRKCIAVSREPCQAAQGTSQSCKIHPDLSSTVPCKEGERICKDDGLTESYWGNCKCSHQNEPQEESIQDASVGEDTTRNDGNSEVGQPELQSEPNIPETECSTGQTRPCYPASMKGCIFNNAKGGYECTGACKTGKESCLQGTWSDECKAATVPVEEVCDTKDNNCNGQTDEDLPNCTKKCKTDNDCSPAYPKCQGGQCIRFCKVHTDCDDTYWCQQGYCQTCPDGGKRSAQEVCDGKDNNCDGQTDVEFDKKGTSCQVPNKLGLCEPGTYTSCKNGSLVCTGPSPTTESCNGKDDDCDGQIDNRCGFVWGVSTGSGGQPNLSGVSLATDAMGNHYILGRFFAQARFGRVILTSNGSWSTFVAKLDNKGQFVWASAIITNSSLPKDIQLDSSGNLYVVGHFEGEAQFGTTTMTSVGNNDIFIAKLDNKGQFVWTLSAGGKEHDYAGSLSLDSSGNLYLTGRYVGPASFGSTTFTARNNGNVFVTKISSQGSFQWTVSAQGGTSSGIGIATINAGGLYLSGTWSGAVSFGTTSIGGQQKKGQFFAKLDPKGQFSWLVVIDGTNGAAGGLSLGIDSAGNLICTGVLQGVVAFGTTTLLAPINQTSMFVAKLDTQGKWLWATTVSSKTTSRGQDLVLDTNDNIYVTGQLNPPVSFGQTTLSLPSHFLFVSKLNAKGSFIWAISAEAQTGRSISIDQQGKLYVLGDFKGNATFGTSSLSSPNGRDIFVAKLNY